MPGIFYFYTFTPKTTFRLFHTSYLFCYFPWAIYKVPKNFIFKFLYDVDV